MSSLKISIKKVITQVAGNILPTCKPNFLILGAQKAGTSSLNHYLNQHPKIKGSTIKEVRFFDRDENYFKGENWYHNYFLQNKNTSLYFDATPEYIYRSVAAERIYNYNPNIKLIVLLREPVKRAYSSWNMYRDFLEKTIPDPLFRGYVKERENNLYKELYGSGPYPSFEACMTEEMKKMEEGSELQEPSFIRRGIYIDQLNRVFKFFPKKQVLVLGFKDLVTDRVNTLNKVLDFLDMEKNSWDFLDDQVKNKRKYVSTIAPETEAKLQNFYAPYNKQLEELLGHQVNW